MKMRNLLVLYYGTSSISLRYTTPVGEPIFRILFLGHGHHKYVYAISTGFFSHPNMPSTGVHRNWSFQPWW